MIVEGYDASMESDVTLGLLLRGRTVGVTIWGLLSMVADHQFSLFMRQHDSWVLCNGVLQITLVPCLCSRPQIFFSARQRTSLTR